MEEVKKSPIPTLEDDMSRLIGIVKSFFAWLNCERLKVIFLGIIASAIIIMFVLGIQRGIGLGRYQVAIGKGDIVQVDTYTGKVWDQGEWVELEEMERRRTAVWQNILNLEKRNNATPQIR